jgi:hypothetical protein
METFGIKGDYAFDLITSGLQKTGDPTGSLLDAMTEFAPIFNDMGFGASEMLSVLETGMAGGAKDANVLGQAMTQFNAKLKDGSAESAIWEMGLGDLNYQFVRGQATGEDMMTGVLQGLKEIDDPLKRSRLGTQLFGEKWNEVGENALLAMDTAGDGLKDVIGATDRAGDAMQRGPRQAWERFTRTVKMGLADALGPYIEKGLLRAIPLLESLGQWVTTVGIPVMSTFAGWIDQSGALDAVASAADWLAGALSSLSPESITLLAVALGAVAAPSIAAGVVSLVGTIGGMAGAMSSAALAAAPLMLILGVVAAYESNFGGLRDKIADVRADFASGDIDGGFQNIAEALISIPRGIVTEVIDPLIGPDLKGGLEAWNGIADNLGRIKDALPGFIGSKLSSLGQDLEDQLVTPFRDKVETVKGLLTGDSLSSLKNAILYIPAGLLTWLADLGNGLLSTLTTPFIGAIASIIAKITGEDPDSIKQTLSGLPDKILEWVGDMARPGLQIGQAFLDAMIGVLKQIPAKFIKLINDAIPNQISIDAGFLGSVSIDLPPDPIPVPDGYARGGVLRGLGITGEEGAELTFANQPMAILSHDKSVSAIQDAFGIPSWSFAGAGGVSINGPLHLHGVEDPEDFLNRLDKVAQRKNKTLLKRGRTNRES